jgi:hypothetical protein
MANPTPAQAAPAAVAALPGAATGKPQHQFVIRYRRRMKHQRVYPLVVELRSADGKPTPPAADSVLVRAIVPGAYVSPAEQEMSARATNNRVTFYVTPLARGRLKEARVAVLQGGRTLQEVWTPMKSVTQRKTWWLLLLSFVVPLVLWYVTMSLDFSSTGPLPPPPEPKDKGGAAVKEDKPKDTEEPSEPEKKDEPAPEAKEKDKKKAKDAKAPAKQVKGRLAQAIVKYVPDYDGYTYKGAAYAQEYYDIVRNMMMKDYLLSYVFAGMLGLTLVSAVLHRTARGKRKSKPLALASSVPDTGNPLVFTAPGQPLR